MKLRKKSRSTQYSNLGTILLEQTEILRPPERLTVTQAAEKYRWLNNPGAYVGPYKIATTMYMEEPQDTFTSPLYSGLVFVGPAQSSKTESLLLNTLTYAVKVDPMDMIIYSPTGANARDFSLRRVDRLHLHSKAVGEMLGKSRDADNTFDKHYSNGMILTLSWPSVAEFAGKPVPRVLLTDYDRMDDDIGGDGSPFDLASKRTTTFKSNAMAVAESSPSKPLEDPRWVPSTPHEAPPAKGILGLYNRGDRRRWQWPCLHCWTWFEGEWAHMVWDDSLPTVVEKADTARMICPHCGTLIHPDEREEMQMWGRWVPEGMTCIDGKLKGSPVRTQIASFWLKGVAAAFVSWKKLVMTYLDALGEYERTRSEEALAKFFNTDLGEVYRPKAMETTRTPEDLKAVANHAPEKVVPHGVRFLVATIDVQKNRWVVQVFGIAPGMPFDIHVVDRFEIIKSKRIDAEGERYWVKPETYLEDWDLITEQVLEKTYPLADESGRYMQIKLAGCDSGGKDGVTSRAYEFYRKLRTENKHRRFYLLKGDRMPSAPRQRIHYPDSSNKSNKSAARGDIPVLFLNGNMLKDDLDGRLNSITPGTGMVHLPKWLPDQVFEEMCAEIRTEKGWERVAKSPNEAWDLAAYCIGLCVGPLSIEALDWENPPGWAAEWDDNDLVSQTAAPRFAGGDGKRYDFGSLGRALN